MLSLLARIYPLPIITWVAPGTKTGTCSQARPVLHLGVVLGWHVVQEWSSLTFYTTNRDTTLRVNDYSHFAQNDFRPWALVFR